jgi:hypothetical protein
MSEEATYQLPFLAAAKLFSCRYQYYALDFPHHTYIGPGSWKYQILLEHHSVYVVYIEHGRA